MGAIGAIVPTSTVLGAAPSGVLAASVPSPSSVAVCPWALSSFADIPELRGVLQINGIDPMRHVVGDAQIVTGPLAPSAALTATPTQVRATASITADGSGTSLAAADSFLLRDVPVGSLPAAGYGQIAFRATLSASPATHEVVGTSTNDAAVLANIQKLVNGTGTHGVDYYDYNIGAGTGDAWFPNHTDITSPTVSATVCAFRAKTYGVVGNSYSIAKGTDAGNTFSVAAWGSGAGGTGTEPESGDYIYGYAHVRQADQAQTGLSPTTSVAVDGNGNVSLSVIANAVDADVDIKRWFRSKTNGSSDELHRGYDIPEADTTDTDDISNDDLDGRFGNVTYDPSIYRTYEAGYPPRGRYVARYKGRYWTSGAFLAADTPTNTNWTVTLTNGSRTVTVPGGSSAYLTSAMNGRTLYPTTAAGLGYGIVYVVESTQTMHLDREYEGTTATTAVTIKDERDPYELYFSEPLLVNNWPSANAIQGVRSPSGVGCTGLFPIWESLIVFTPTGVWRVTGDGPFSIHHDWEGPGCVSGHSIQEVDGLLYWLGPDGVYRWDGGGAPEKISSPPSPGPVVVGIDRTFARINMAHAARSVSHYDPVDKIIRWYVPGELDLRETADGIECTNRYALVYDLHSGAWSIDTCEDVTAVASVVKGNGERATLTGDIQGVLMHIDIGNSDGAFSIDSVEVTSGSCTTSTVAVTTTPAWTSALIGCPLWVADSSGNVQRVCVASATTGSATTRRQMTALSSGAYVMPGGIGLDIETAWYHLGVPWRKKTRRRCRTYFDVQSAGEVFYATAKDGGTPTVRTGDTKISLATGDGEDVIYVCHRGRTHKDRWLALQAGVDVVLQGFTMDFADESVVA